MYSVCTELSPRKGVLSTPVAKVFPTLRTSIAKAVAESRTLLSGKINVKFATVLHLDYILGRWRR